MRKLLPVLLLLILNSGFVKGGATFPSFLKIPTDSLHLNDTIKAPAKIKKDKRGLFSVTSAWQNLDPYLGSYDTTEFQYLNFEVRYKFWFGLFGAVNPEFYFNKDSIEFVGNNLILGVDREWFDNFFGMASYSYNIHKDNAIRTLRNLYRNDVNVTASYENDYITPELKYDFTFGDVTGGKLNRTGGYKPVTVFGYDNVINLGISHTFTIFDSTRHGDLNIKVGNFYNFGTANALLTSREIIPNPDYDPKKKKGKAYEYLDIPYTDDKFSALNTELYVNVDYTWRFMEIIPTFNFSAPFRNLAAAQSAAATVIGPKGNEIVPAANIVSKVFVYGGVSLLFNVPYRKIK